MKKEFINQLPELYKKNLVTEKQAVGDILQYVVENRMTFGLKDYDEDFCSEVYFRLFEKAPSLLQNYKTIKGDFTGFIFNAMEGFIHSETKRKSRNFVCDFVCNNDSILNYKQELEIECVKGDNQGKYKISTVPYSLNLKSQESLREIFHNLKNRKDKANIIMALRTACYLDDQIIDNMCIKYKINKDDFLSNIQKCKDSQNKKLEKSQEYIESRNKAYFYHRKYELQINHLKQYQGLEEETSRIIRTLSDKNNCHFKRWKVRNTKLHTSTFFLRTSNKIIAEILNLCERQVAYYLKQTLEQIEKETE